MPNVRTHPPPQPANASNRPGALPTREIGGLTFVFQFLRPSVAVPLQGRVLELVAPLEELRSGGKIGDAVRAMNLSDPALVPFLKLLLSTMRVLMKGAWFPIYSPDENIDHFDMPGLFDGPEGMQRLMGAVRFVIEVNFLGPSVSSKLADALKSVGLVALGAVDLQTHDDSSGTTSAVG